MTDSHLSLVLLPTLRCNAACEYCFEDSRSGDLGLEGLSVVIGTLLDHMEAGGLGEATIYWQGGEVMTLGPRWFEEAHGIIEGLAAARGRRIHNSLQSNLIGYTRAWEPIVKTMFDGSIGSSLDYPNLYRRGVGGSPEEFNQTWLRAYREVQEAGIEVGVISVPNTATLDLGAERFYSYFVDECGITDFQLNTPFAGGAPNQAKHDLPLAPRRLGRFLAELADIWLERGHGDGVRLGPFDELLRYFGEGHARLPCIWQDNCAKEFCCIDPEGNVAQCDCWITSYPEFRFGNILRGGRSLSDVLEQSEPRSSFRARPEALIRDEDCVDCDYLAVCHGGCPVRAYTRRGRLNDKDPYCETYRDLFAHMEKAAARVAGHQLEVGRARAASGS